MRVLHVCFNMGYSEGLNYQENCESKWHVVMGHEVTILSTEYCFEEGIWKKTSKSNDYVNELGVHIIRLPYKYKLPYNINRQLGIFKDTYSVVSKINPDVICIHNMQFQDLHTFVRYKKNNPNVKIYVDSHSDFSNSARNWISKNVLYKFWWKPCAKSIEKSAEVFYGVMPSRVEFMINILGISRSKCSLLYMGADDDAVKYAVSEVNINDIKNKYSVCENDFLIVTGGKIDKFKAQTILLMKAVKEIKNPNIRLMIFGSVDDDLKSEFTEFVDGKKIMYLGWAKGNDSYNYFAAADLVFFPGRHSVYWEQVVGLGKPMVCKYWDGTTHVDLGGNVLFVKEDNSDKYKEIIEYLYTNREKLKDMESIAKKKGMSEFSYKEISKKAIGQY